MVIFSFHSSAEAGPIGKDAFINPTIIGFESPTVEGSDCVTNQYSGITFTSSTSFFGCYGGVVDTSVGEGQLLSVVGDIIVTFTEIHNRVGFDYLFGLSPMLTLKIYDSSSNLVDLTSSNISPGFLGLESSVGIKTVKIHDSGFDFKIDNLRYNSFSVPEPPSLLLLGLGILTFGFWGRKRLKN